MLVNHVIIMHTLPVQLAGKCCVSSENNTLNIGPRIRRARLCQEFDGVDPEAIMALSAETESFKRLVHALKGAIRHA